MASFTDNSQALSNFNPYIQQVPVDAYVAVGMQKQLAYEQGVQRTQSEIDQVANLPVIKAEQKDYLQQRIGQLQSSVSKVVGQDFSNSQLVNQIGGLTSQIASDPIVQSAVQSTMHYQAESAKMDEAQKAGKSSPDNEYDFQHEFAKWMGDKNVKSSFTGTYTPYIDVNKKALDAINALHPIEQLQQLPFQMENGQLKLVNGAPIPDMAMIQKMTKSLTPETITAALSAALGPAEMNQLAISGRYEYRGYDKVALKQLNDDSYNHQLHYINETLKGFGVQKMSNTTDMKYQQDLDDKIKQYELQRDSLIQKYPSDVKLLDQNPDAYKGELYKQNWIGNMNNGYSYATNALTYHDNPFWKGNMENQRMALENTKFALDYGPGGFKSQQLDIERARLNIEMTKALKESGKKKDKNGNIVDNNGLTDSLMAPVEGVLTADNMPSATLAAYQGKTQELNDMLTASNLKIATQKFPEMMDFTGGTVKYKDAASKAYVETALASLRADIGNPKKTVDPDVVEWANDTDELNLNVANRNAGLNRLIKTAPKSPFNEADGVTLNSPYFKNGPVHVSGDEIGEFTRKLAYAYKQDPQIFTGPGMGGGPTSFHYDDEQAKELFTTPQEEVMYQAVKKASAGEPLSQGQQEILKRVGNATAIIGKNGKALDERTKYLSDNIGKLIQVDKPANFPIMAAKPEDKYAPTALANNLISNFKKAGASTLPSGTKIGDIEKLMKDPERTFALQSAGGGNYNLVINNASGDEAVIPMTAQQLQDNFPGANVSQFSAIKSDLALTKLTGKATTDVQNNGEMSARTLTNGNLNNYSVKYHIEEPKGGKYVVRAYIKDKDGKMLYSGLVPLPGLPNDSQLSGFLANFGDQQIEDMLRPK